MARISGTMGITQSEYMKCEFLCSERVSEIEKTRVKSGMFEDCSRNVTVFVR